MWSKKGKNYQPVVMTRSQHQQRINVFGWVDLIHGRHRMIRCPKGNTSGFLMVLSNIRNTFKGKRIHLWVDRARWHKGKKVDPYFETHKEFFIHYIPAYHPELNLQEILWRTMRYEETTNTYFESIDDLAVNVFKRSQRWKPSKILSLCHLT
jgi:transposase